MKKLVLISFISTFFIGTGFAATQNTLTPEEISGLQSEVAECPKDEIGKVMSVSLKPGQPASKKENIEWAFKVRLANNKIINSPTYQPKGKSPSRYIGQTICTKERD
jgi:hypothetical protein